MKWFSIEREDEWVWKGSSYGCFSIKHAYNELVKHLIDNRDYHWDKVWIKNMVPKINSFWWVASHGRILTIDNLDRRGFQLVNRCTLCKQDEESIMHLFFHCQFSREVWSFFLPLLFTNWVFPHTMKSFVKSWSNCPFSHKVIVDLWNQIPPS